MDDLTLTQIARLQKDLQHHYRRIWKQPSPELGRSTLLWTIAEISEMADIIKKKGDAAIMQDAEVRHDFMEELCDVLMYLGDVMLDYDLDPEEVARIYKEKHLRNMSRWDPK